MYEKYLYAMVRCEKIRITAIIAVMLLAFMFAAVIWYIPAQGRYTSRTYTTTDAAGTTTTTTSPNGHTVTVVTDSSGRVVSTIIIGGK